MCFAAINLKPYQGLKHNRYMRVIRLTQAAINLKPYQGLKQQQAREKKSVVPILCRN